MEYGINNQMVSHNNTSLIFQKKFPLVFLNAQPENVTILILAPMNHIVVVV